MNNRVIDTLTKSLRHFPCINFAFVLFAFILLSGCGNQMFRQPSYQPLDAPRAQGPSQSIPVGIDRAPFDAQIIASPSNGDLQASNVLAKDTAFANREPDLPPANLSDNARNMPMPSSVDSVQSPYDISDPNLISGGNTMFLNRCVQCHNAGGYGYGVVGSYLVPHPPDLSSPDVQKRSDGALFWVISVGEGKMPGFRNWTSTKERWELVAYVRNEKHSKADKSLLLSDHVSDTSNSPYPVYGELGFEHGRNRSAFKALGSAPSSASSRVYTDGTESEELVTTTHQ